MEFLPYSRTPSGEIYTIEHEGNELGELAIIYGQNDLQAIAGIRTSRSEDERDQVDLAIADFIENLAEASDIEYFQVNIYDTDNFTSIDNYEDDDDEEVKGCSCDCHAGEYPEDL